MIIFFLVVVEFIAVYWGTLVVLGLKFQHLCVLRGSYVRFLIPRLLWVCHRLFRGSQL